MRPNGGRDRPHCIAEGCGFIFFGDFSIGCGGVVIRDRKESQNGDVPGTGIQEALLVQRGQYFTPGSMPNTLILASVTSLLARMSRSAVGRRVW